MIMYVMNVSRYLIIIAISAAFHAKITRHIDGYVCNDVSR